MQHVYRPVKYHSEAESQHRATLVLCLGRGAIKHLSVLTPEEGRDQVQVPPYCASVHISGVHLFQETLEFDFVLYIC